MRRSFTIIALLIAAILGGLAVEIVAPSLAMAQEPWSPPQWTPEEMQVVPGTCQTQYDGYIVVTGYPFASSEAHHRDSFLLNSLDEAHSLRANLCGQYTRDKGWEIPDHCQSIDYRDGQGRVLQHHYYCYCMRDAVIECVGRWGKDTDVMPVIIEPSSRRQASPTRTPISQPERQSSTAEEVAQAFVRAAELVREIARALRDDSSVSNPRPSGTPYVSPSRRADDLYARGMAAYAKPSHTDEETITALSSFGACIEEDPYHTPCIWQLGWVFWANGDYNLTDILWRRVKQIDPNHASVDEWLDKLQRKL